MLTGSSIHKIFNESTNNEYSKRKSELAEVIKTAKSLLSSYKSKGLKYGVGLALKPLTEKDRQQVKNDTVFNMMKENLKNKLEDFYNGDEDQITIITGDLRLVAYGTDEGIDNIPDNQFRKDINDSWSIVDKFLNEFKKLVSNNKNISGHVDMDGDKYEFQIDYYI